MGSLWKTTTRPNIETPTGGQGEKRKTKSRADAANVYSDQAKKAEALTRDHQDKLSFRNASPSLAKGNKRCSVLLPHGHNLKPKLLAWPKRQNHAPVNGIIVEGHDLWLSFLRITLPITPNMEENICFHWGSPPIMPYRLLKHGKEHIGVINLDFKLESIKHSAGLQMGTIVKKLRQSKGLQSILTGLDMKSGSLR